MPPRAPPAPGPRPPPRAREHAGRPWRWLLLLALPAACSAPPRAVYTNHWAVQVLGGPAAADRVAAAHGYLNLGQVSAPGRAPQTFPAAGGWGLRAAPARSGCVWGRRPGLPGRGGPARTPARPGRGGSPVGRRARPAGAVLVPRGSGTLCPGRAAWGAGSLGDRRMARQLGNVLAWCPWLLERGRAGPHDSREAFWAARGLSSHMGARWRESCV